MMHPTLSPSLPLSAHPLASQCEAIADRLAGARPTNRTQGRFVGIDAANDYEAAAAFLQVHEASPHTFRSYHKEIERFLMWCAIENRKPLSEMKHGDFVGYCQFLASPPPSWVMPAEVRAKRFTEKWKPLRGPLKGKSLKFAFSVVKSMVAWLVDMNYLESNPAGSLKNVPLAEQSAREKIETDLASPTRSALTPEAIAFVNQHLDDLPSKSPRETEAKTRLKACMAIFLATGCRLSELATAEAGFLRVHHGRWWLLVLGKGNKAGKLPVGPDILSTVCRYRLARGLNATPHPDDTWPLIAHLGNPAKAISSGMIYRLVKDVLKQAAGLAKDAGDAASEHQLAAASTHWLRHTSLSRLAENTKDVRLVRRLGRHASADTTMGYLTEEDDRFHDRVVVSQAAATRGD